MTNNFYSSVDGNHSRVASDFTSRLTRLDSLSIVSRQSVLGLVLLVLTLFTGVGNVWGANAPVNTTLWGENFAHFGTKTPSSAGTGSGTTIYGSATITYSQNDTGTKGYNEKLAGGTAPELLLKQSNKTWTISGIPTGGATGMSLTFKSNKTTFDVTVSSTKLAVSGSQKSWTISLKSGQTDPGTFNLTIKNTGSANARIDDVVLKVTTAGSSKSDLTLGLSYSHNPIILGEDASSSPTLTGNSGSGTVTYTLEDVSPSGCVTINASTGVLTPVKVGTATVRASVAETSSYNAGSKTCAVSVVKKYTVTLKDDDSALPQTTVGGSVSLPPREGCEGYTFAGWTKTWTSAQASWTTGKPDIIEAGSYTPTEDEDLYPVYTKIEDGGDPVSVSGGEMNNGVGTTGWQVSGTGTYSGNGVKFDGAGEYIQSPSLLAGKYKSLTVKLKAGYNGSQGSVLTIASLNSSGNVIDSEDFTPTQVYNGQTTIYSFELGGSENIQHIRVTMKTKTSNVGMKYCEVFAGGSTTYYISEPNCCTPLGQIKGTFFLTHFLTHFLARFLESVFC